MFIIGYLLMAVVKVLHLVINIFLWVVVARAILSWVSPDPYNPIVRFIHNVTEPVLYRIRTFLPVSFGGIDISPVIAILGVYFVDIFVVNSLARIAEKFL